MSTMLQIKDFCPGDFYIIIQLSMTHGCWAVGYVHVEGSSVRILTATDLSRKHR